MVSALFLLLCMVLHRVLLTVESGSEVLSFVFYHFSCVLLLRYNPNNKFYTRWVPYKLTFDDVCPFHLEFHAVVVADQSDSARSSSTHVPSALPAHHRYITHNC